MAATADQFRWVDRVLGVRPRNAAPGGTLLPVWRDAKDAVDQQINDLCRAVREIDHPLTQALVNGGLSSFTSGLIVPLTASLMASDAGSDATAKRVAAEKATALQAFLASNSTVRLIDENPFGVSVSIARTLGAALETIIGAAHN